MPKTEKSSPYTSTFFITVNTNKDYRYEPEIFDKLKVFMKEMTMKKNFKNYLKRDKDDKITKIRNKHIVAVAPGKQKQIHTHLLCEIIHTGKSLRFDLAKIRKDIEKATGLSSIHIDPDILRNKGDWDELSDYINRNA